MVLALCRQKLGSLGPAADVRSKVGQKRLQDRPGHRQSEASAVRLSEA